MSDIEVIDWPRDWWGVVSCEFGLMPRSLTSQSPWTATQSVYGPHVQYWQAKLKFPVMTSDELATREAIIESLGGQSGLLRMGHPFRMSPLFNSDVDESPSGYSDGTFFDDGSGWANGYLPSTITVWEEADHGGDSVVVTGLPALTNRPLRRGDLVEFRRNGIADLTPSLHRIKRDASTDSSGTTRIEIMPTLRKQLAVGDMCVLDFPTTVFRLMSNDTGFVQRDLSYTGNFEIDLMEAIF